MLNIVCSFAMYFIAIYPTVFTLLMSYQEVSSFLVFEL